MKHLINKLVLLVLVTYGLCACQSTEMFVVNMDYAVSQRAALDAMKRDMTGRRGYQVLYESSSQLDLEKDQCKVRLFFDDTKKLIRYEFASNKWYCKYRPRQLG
jgi:hypothetical protein